MSRERPKKTFYTVLGIVGDIIFIPVMILALIVCMIVFMDRRQNEVPSFFGVSVVRVLSGSMKASGFDIGDNVLVKKIAVDEIWEGDIIAFYSKYDKVDNDLSMYNKLTKLNSQDDEIVVSNPPVVIEGRSTVEDAQEQKCRVVFHEVKEVWCAENGTRFFKTKGTSNGDYDTYKIREDFVIGRYIETSVFLRNSIKWISSPIGMIVLVCLPLGILIILQSLSLIEQINFIVIEKKLLSGKMHWSDSEAMRLIKSGEMEEIAKIIYLGNIKEDEREMLFDELWLVGPKNKTKKIIEKERKITQGYNILQEKGKLDYFNFWKNNVNTKKEKQLIENEISYNIMSSAINNENK